MINPNDGKNLVGCSFAHLTSRELAQFYAYLASVSGSAENAGLKTHSCDLQAREVMDEIVKREKALDAERICLERREQELDEREEELNEREDDLDERD